MIYIAIQEDYTLLESKARTMSLSSNAVTLLSDLVKKEMSGIKVTKEMIVKKVQKTNHKTKKKKRVAKKRVSAVPNNITNSKPKQRKI